MQRQRQRQGLHLHNKSKIEFADRHFDYRTIADMSAVPSEEPVIKMTPLVNAHTAGANDSGCVSKLDFYRTRHPGFDACFQCSDGVKLYCNKALLRRAECSHLSSMVSQCANDGVYIVRAKGNVLAEVLDFCLRSCDRGKLSLDTSLDVWTYAAKIEYTELRDYCARKLLETPGGMLRAYNEQPELFGADPALTSAFANDMNSTQFGGASTEGLSPEFVAFPDVTEATIIKYMEHTTAGKGAAVVRSLCRRASLSGKVLRACFDKFGEDDVVPELLVQLAIKVFGSK